MEDPSSSFPPEYPRHPPDRVGMPDAVSSPRTFSGDERTWDGVDDDRIGGGLAAAGHPAGAAGPGAAGAEPVPRAEPRHRLGAAVRRAGAGAGAGGGGAYGGGPRGALAARLLRP